MKWPRYSRGFTDFDFNVTDGHETEAEAAEKAKRANRFGVFVLRLLGFKGTPPEPKITGASSPDHERPVH
jgi:hypothetical protein